MSDSTANILADVFNSVIPSKQEKPKFKHRDGEVTAYLNYSLGSGKLESVALRDGRADHNQIVESYRRAAKSAQPEAAKATLDAYWMSKMTVSFNFSQPAEKKTLDISDMPSFA